MSATGSRARRGHLDSLLRRTLGLHDMAGDHPERVYLITFGELHLQLKAAGIAVDWHDPDTSEEEDARAFLQAAAAALRAAIGDSEPGPTEPGMVATASEPQPIPTATDVTRLLDHRDELVRRPTSLRQRGVTEREAWEALDEVIGRLPRVDGACFCEPSGQAVKVYVDRNGDRLRDCRDGRRCDGPHWSLVALVGHPD